VCVFLYIYIHARIRNDMREGESMTTVRDIYIYRKHK
jgi:hypothetical protein